jgi:hypothetical protein
MIEQAGVRRERRRHTRIAPKGTVILHAAGHAQRGRVANLGEGGMLVATNVTVPDRLLARAVEIDVRLDGMSAQWLHASGRIVRIAADGVAVTFDLPPAGLVRVIDEMSTASRARLRVISIVLIDLDPQRRAAMAAGFQAAGCFVVEASTPLEALVRLGESTFEPDLIAIADSIPSTVAGELRTFVEREHPRAKLVTIGDEAVDPAGVEHWLSSADPGADLANRVREVLGRHRHPTRP